MLVVCILGFLAATAIPAFTTYLRRSKTAEAVQGVQKMAIGEMDYYGKNQAFLPAGPTNIPPASFRRTGDFTTDPNWNKISFLYADQIYYGYQANVVGTNEVDCDAVGDLNGDGITSLFQRIVTVDARGNLTVGGLFVLDELD